MSTQYYRSRLFGRYWPSIAHVSRSNAKFLGVTSVLGLIGLQIWAISNSYALRVIGDTPSFLPLIRDLGRDPLTEKSTFFGTPDTASIHTSPYLQVLGLLWRVVAPNGGYDDPIEMGHYVAILCIPISLGLLGALWLFTRRVAGVRAAYLAVPAILLVFGPVHVSWSSDLSLNGMLYGGYYPTTFATALTLVVLMLLPRTSLGWSAATAAIIALTITTDPLNGAVLSAILVLYAARAGMKTPREAVRIPVTLAAGFGLALLWPTFSIAEAFSDSGLPIPYVLAVALLAPGAWVLAYPRLHSRLPGREGWLGRSIGPQQEVVFAIVGALAVIGLAIWGVITMIDWPTNQPLLGANRLGFYWNADRYRWLLLLGPGIIGIVGLNRLARRGHPELLMWVVGFYSIGIVGSLADLLHSPIQIPLYYRFILMCQIPIAIGVAYFLVQHHEGRALKLTGLTLAAVLVFKVVTLVGVSDRLTYFGARLPPMWSMGNVIPPNSGVVAADPGTSYYVPVATQNRVLTVSAGHTDSGNERDHADAGYLLMRDLYRGTPPEAARALAGIWHRGVRWVVVEKFTTLSLNKLQDFSNGPYESIAKQRDADVLTRYNARLTAGGDLVAENDEIAIYRLDGNLIRQASQPPAVVSSATRAHVASLLRKLSMSTPIDALTIGAELRDMGVRIVAVSHGLLGSTPRISAYSERVSDRPMGQVRLPGYTKRQNCEALCVTAAKATRTLGIPQIDDERETISRLS